MDHTIKDIVPILQILQKIILTADFYRVISEAFKVINVMFYIIGTTPDLQKQIGLFQAKIKDVIPIILEKLKSNDLDLEIKQSIILCSSSLIINLGEFLKNDEKLQII